jgi:streptogrisin C
VIHKESTMFSRTRTRVGLAVLGAASLGLSTMAAAGPLPRAELVKGEDVAAANGRDVELVAKEFGWDLGATARHLEAQRAFGSLIGTIAQKLPDRYAGAEFAPEPGASSRIMVKGKAPDELRSLVAGSGLPVELLEGMRYSERELQQRSVEVVRALGQLGYSEVGSAVLPSGEIQVAVNGDPAAAQKLPRELLDGVSIVQSPKRMIVNEDVEGGVQVYATTGGSCTSGFSVRSTSTGTTGVSTAAHCTGINRYSLPGPNNDPTLFHQSEHLGIFGDVEWKTTTDVEIARYWASPTDNRAVTSVWPAGSYAVNMTTCVHSRINATRSCDQIYSTFVNSLSGLTLVSSLIATDTDNTSPGDSGGPWSFGTIADGGHRGDQWIWFGTRNVFTKADLFPAALGVEVMT